MRGDSYVRWRQVRSLVLILAVWGMVGPIALADQPALAFEHGPLVTQDGRFTLRWAPSPTAGEYDYVRLEMSVIVEGEPPVWHPHFVSGSKSSFAIYAPGNYQYRVRPCVEIDGEAICGEASATVAVEVAEVARDARPAQLHSELAVPDTQNTIQGAASVIPGQYESSLTDYNGWYLFWVNDLRYTSLDEENYQNANHLLLTWVTYRDFAGDNPPLGEENLQPVWLTGWLNQTATDAYYGSLVYTRIVGGEVVRETVGNITLDVSAGKQNPKVTWQVFDGTFYAQEVRPVEDSLIWDPIAFGFDEGPNPIDHFSGWWSPASDAELPFGMLVFSTGEWEANLLKFFDGQGEPIWAVDFNVSASPTPEPTTLRHFVVKDSWYPDVPYPGHVPTILGLDSGHSGTWTVRREFGPVLPHPDDRGGLVLDLMIPEHFRGTPSSTNYGQVASPAPILKLVSHHDVRYFVDGNESAAECVLQQGQCTIELTWFSDGDYPDAKVYRRLKSGGDWTAPSLIAGWQTSGNYSVERFPHLITEPGTYRFELRRDGSNSKLIGLSRELEANLPSWTGPMDVQYEYDALGRLIRVGYEDGSAFIYSYDVAGNRILHQVSQ